MESEAGHSEDVEVPLAGASDPAIAIAVAKGRSDPSVARDTSAFLRKQTEYVGLQMENLHEQRLLQTRFLKRRELSDRLRLALQILGVAAGAVVAVIVFFLILDAVRSDALVIEPVAAPPDLQAKGMTPTVLSAQLLDKLRAMQARTDSARAPDTFKGANGDDIKLEIPETGVSIGELQRALRERLGNDVHVTAEAFHRQDRLVLTVRVGELPGQSYEGSEGDLDTMMQQAAEGVFARTEPYRFSVFLSQNGKTDAALAVLRQATTHGPRSERAWAYVGLGGQLGAMGRMSEAQAATRRGLALDPTLAAGWSVLSSIAQAQGHDEEALAAARATRQTLARSDRGGVTPRAKAQDMISANAMAAELVGDFRRGEGVRAGASRLEGYQFNGPGHAVEAAIDAIFAHQRTSPWPVALAGDDPETPVYRARLLAAEAWARDDWSRALPAIEQLQTVSAAAPDAAERARLWPVEVWPWQAYGYARSGRVAEARALIERTPLDCYLCLRMRGEIAALAGDRRGADDWFGRAVRTAPSLPFAYGEWGRAVDGFGDHDRARQLFASARARGPDWPDPLLWQGESLLRQGRAADASPRFRAALAAAPGWPAAKQGAARAEAASRGSH